MDAQELRNLQEAYLEVVIGEGKVEWDNPKRHLPSGLTPREKNRAKRISTGVENPNIKPSEKKLERYGKLKIAHDDEKGKKVPRNKRHHFSQFDTGPFVSDPVSKRREQKNKLKDLKELVKEDFDLYDIILSHLLDEGYADTEQAAEAIMVNMSEDWRESIVEQIVYGGVKTTDTPADSKPKTMVITAADKAGNTKAYQNFKAGDPRYSAASHLKGV